MAEIRLEWPAGARVWRAQRKANKGWRQGMETKDGDCHQQRIDLQPVAGSLHWSQIGFHEAWWNGKGVLKDLHSSLTIIMEMRMIRTSTMIRRIKRMRMASLTRMTSTTSLTGTTTRGTTSNIVRRWERASRPRAPCQILPWLISIIPVTRASNVMGRRLDLKNERPPPSRWLPPFLAVVTAMISIALFYDDGGGDDDDDDDWDNDHWDDDEEKLLLWYWSRLCELPALFYGDWPSHRLIVPQANTFARVPQHQF